VRSEGRGRLRPQRELPAADAAADEPVLLRAPVRRHADLPAPLKPIRLSTRAAALIGALALTPAAGADRVISANLAGYAAHGRGDHFREISGSWNQPKLVCKRGHKTYVTIWVGLGGFAPNSITTEQIGTEGDCHADGRQVAYAWYQLMPGPHSPVPMRIKPGDKMEAVVMLGRWTVTLVLANHTDPQVYTQTLLDTLIDDSAADWMVQARPFCLTPIACRTLPLANFRYVCFGRTTARLANGHVGAVTDPAWRTTAVSIGRHGRRYGTIARASTAATTVGAVPSAICPDGSSFTVNYRPLSVGSNPFL
jgi:Peptidase A4 family